MAGSRSRASWDDIDAIGIFLQRVEELQRTRFVERAGQVGYTLNFSKMAGISFQSREPDEEDLRSFLLTFRRFVADGDPLNIGHIHNICERRLRSDDLRRHLREARAHWRRDAETGGMSLVFNGRQISPEYVADLFINGHYFHDEPAKRAKLASLREPLEYLVVRHHFLNFVLDGTRQVFYVANVLTVAIREGQLEGWAGS